MVNNIISLQLNKWLEPYYTKVEKLSRAGKISALKKKQEQEKQLKELSELNSSQHMSNICPTINQSINQSINQDSDSEEEAEAKNGENGMKIKFKNKCRLTN